MSIVVGNCKVEPFINIDQAAGCANDRSKRFKDSYSIKKLPNGGYILKNTNSGIYYDQGGCTYQNLDAFVEEV